MRIIKMLFRFAAVVWIFVFMLYLFSTFSSEASVPQRGYKTKTPVFEPTNTPEPTRTLVPTTLPTDTPEPTKTPEPKWTLGPTATPTDRPYDCHIDGDGICPGEETPPPVIIFYTPTPIPTLAPTERVAEIAPQAALICPVACCCDGHDIRIGIGSEAVDYSEAILKLRPIAYMLVGIFGANTLLKTYGTFRKD